MSKIVLSIIIMAIVSQTFCQGDLRFLADENVNVESKKLQIVNEAMDLVNGFLEGFPQFNNLPHQNECSPKDAEVAAKMKEIANDIFEIVKIVKNIKFDSTLFDAIKQIHEKSADALTKFSHISVGCSAYSKEIEKQMDRLVDHIKSADYKSELAKHTVLSLGKIANKIRDAVVAISEKKFHDAGKIIGEFINIVFFWNFKPVENTTPVYSFLAVSEVEPKDIIAFFQGLNEGFTFFYHVKGSEDCKVCDKDVQDILDDLNEIAELINTICPENIWESIQVIYMKFMHATQILGKAYDKCDVMAKEIQRIAQLLGDYASKDGYLNSFTFHTLTNVGTIQNYLSTGAAAWKNEEFGKSGKAFGEMIKFMFYWDFKL